MVLALIVYFLWDTHRKWKNRNNAFHRTGLSVSLRPIILKRPLAHTKRPLQSGSSVPLGPVILKGPLQLNKIVTIKPSRRMIVSAAPLISTSTNWDTTVPKKAQSMNHPLV
jgi:hypothetical protein